MYHTHCAVTYCNHYFQDLELLDLEGSCRSLSLQDLSHLSPLTQLKILGLGRWAAQAWYPPFCFKIRLDAYEAAQAEQTLYRQNPAAATHLPREGLVKPADNRAQYSCDGLAHMPAAVRSRGYYSVNGLPGQLAAHVNEYKGMKASSSAMLPREPPECMLHAGDAHQWRAVQAQPGLPNTEFVVPQQQGLHHAVTPRAVLPGVDSGAAWLYTSSACGPGSACAYQDINVGKCWMYVEMVCTTASCDDGLQ